MPNNMSYFRDTVVVACTRCTDKVQQRCDNDAAAAVQRHHVTQAADPGTERQRYQLTDQLFISALSYITDSQINRNSSRT